ncbi:hypothetical protein GJAV_G00125820 [Gymnothorax javanicus]|nr:hypothetical protein GJAV_G00125820 [Gymnothorax javanicus]
MLTGTAPAGISCVSKRRDLIFPRAPGISPPARAGTASDLSGKRWKNWQKRRPNNKPLEEPIEFEGTRMSSVAATAAIFSFVFRRIT